MAEDRNKAQGIVGVLLILFLLCPMSSEVLAGQVLDEFESAKLDEKLWDIMVEGNATFEIENGILTMACPDTESGAMLYYPVNVADMDITIEVKLDTSGIVESLIVGCLAGLLEPQADTVIESNMEAGFFIVPDKWYVKQDTVVIGQKPPNPGIEAAYTPGWNIVKIELSKTDGRIIFSLNGKEVGSVDRNGDVKDRYFYISPDPYTSHYSGEIYIDYIKLSGEGVAVEPMGKSATAWGKIKSTY